MGRKRWRLGSWADTRSMGALGQHRERGVGQCNAISFIHSFVQALVLGLERLGVGGWLLEEGRSSMAKGEGPPLPPDDLPASQRSGRRGLGQCVQVG